jgi:hypothetical protein
VQPTSAADADVTGDLQRYPLPRLLFYLYKRAFMGRLEVDLPGAVTARVYFREGIPAHVEANLPEDFLGRVLLEQGWLDSAQYNQSLALLAQGGKRHGVILRELGFIDDRILVAGLQLQLRRKLNRLFFAENAPFALYGGEHSMGEDAETQHVRADPLWVIHQGVRNAFGSARLEVELAKLHGASVQLRADLGKVLIRFGMDEQEMGLAQVLMRGVVPFEQVFRISNLAPVETQMLVYVFWVTEALTVVEPSEGQPAASVPRSGTDFNAISAPVALGSRGSAPDVLSLAAEFSVEPSLTIAGDIANALGNPASEEWDAEQTGRDGAPGTAGSSSGEAARPGASSGKASPPPLSGFQATVTRSAAPPERTKAVESPPRVSAPTARRRGSKASAVRSGAASQPRIGSQEADALRQEIRKRHAQLDQGTHYEALGVRRGCSVGETRDAFFGLAKRLHPDRVAGAGLDDLAAEAEEVFRSINEAYAVLVDLKLRAEYDKTLDGGGSEAEDEARAMIEAEMMFQRGTVAFRRRDYRGALAQFEEACRLNPKEGEHLAWRAWTRFCDPKLDNSEVLSELRGELHAAIKCSPKNAGSHYFLGEIHLAMGDDKKAIASLKKTVELKPQHVDALRQLRLIRMRQERGKQGMTGLFKKLRKK